MTKDKAIQYLKYLHEVEQNHRANILTQDIAEAIEKVRLEFVAAYRER